MRGLIAAALGGVSRGVGQVAERQIEVNSRKALMEAEEEMNARLAEAAEGRAIAAEGRAETRQIGAEGRAEAFQIGAEGRAEARTIAAENRLDPVETEQLNVLRAQVAGVQRDSAWTEREQGIRTRLGQAPFGSEDYESALQELDSMVTTGTRAQRAQDNVAAGARYVDLAELNFEQAEQLRKDLRDGNIFEPEDVADANTRIAKLQRNAERAMLDANDLLSGGGRGAPQTRPATGAGLLRSGSNPQQPRDLSSFFIQGND
jgi:metal-dependent amidase/aminoacylase/carboxypeptidase family protein